jgi:hypothetical protein
MERISDRIFRRAPSVIQVSLALSISGIAIAIAQAAPWAPLPGVLPAPTNIIPDPRDVPGKDFSDYRDRDKAGFGDAEQVVAWDGLGGVRDGFDYHGVSADVPHPPGVRPLLLQQHEVDALAAGGDALFDALIADQTALIFSVGGLGYPTVGIGDSVLHFVRPTSLPGSVAGNGIWALPPVIDSMNPIPDLDGLELWGGNNADDSDRYSLYGDPTVPVPPTGAGLKVAIWEFAPGTGVSSPHTLTTDLAAAIDMQFGGDGDDAIWSHLVELMDLDAMMTFSSRVIFSIAPIDLSQFGPGLPNFDGGEIFVYTPGSATSFLKQGGHEYNTALDIRTTFNVPIENIDAIEAATAVPEPAAWALALLAIAVVGKALRR